MSSTRFPRRHPVGLVALIPLVLALAACNGADAESAADAPAAVLAPALDSVSIAEDPRAFSGQVSVAVEDPIDPVAEAPSSSLPATLTDAQGTEVVVEDTSRVLALDLHGTLARTVFELGMGESLVGRDLSTQFDEAQDLPLVTGKGHELNAESIVALDPTLIITDTSLGPWDVLLQMRELGVPVVVVDSSRGLDNVGDITEMVADALGVPDEGAALAERTQAEIDEVTSRIDAVAPTENERLRTVFLYVRGQANVYYMFGEGSGADDLIDSVGAYDVAEEIGWKGMRPVTAEGLVAASPELVVMMTKGLESTGGVEGLLEKVPALAQTPAGQNERIVDIEDSVVLGYGPATAAVLNALAVAVLAPEALE